MNFGFEQFEENIQNIFMTTVKYLVDKVLSHSNINVSELSIPTLFFNRLFFAADFDLICHFENISQTM